MTTVVPAIIPFDKGQLEEEIKKVAGFAELVQIDISDGVFTPVKTWPYNGKDVDFFNKLKSEDIGLPMWENVNFEIHLMIKNPEDSVRDWIATGASAIIAHIEATGNFQKIIDICREKMVSVGMGIKPETDVSKINHFVPQVDFIQCMGSNRLGHHGVELEEEALQQIKKLRELYPDSIIGVDIGVTEDTAGRLVSMGVSKLISGSAILDATNPKEVFNAISDF